MRGQDMAEIIDVAGSWPFFADMLVVMNKCAQKHGTNLFTFHFNIKKKVIVYENKTFLSKDTAYVSISSL